MSTQRDEHERATAAAFDGQAAAFERAPIQTDPDLLRDLVAFMDLAPASRVLDAGCGPGLLARAVLDDPAGHTVTGCDLSAEMVARARDRTAGAGARAEFVQAPVSEVAAEIAAGRRAPVDAVVSRYVLHHVPDPAAFLADQVAALRASGGGVLVLADHLADPWPECAEWHRRVEVMRDRTHTRNLTGGELVDLVAAAGGWDVRFAERPIATDFDEWFARGTPSATRQECLDLLLAPEGRRSRAWNVEPLDDSGNAMMRGVLAMVRGVVG
ncbi:MAG: class I SAM-dependent methyltransferase [Thermoleophilia bacterium]|nr:class I SAM-dependent methyltransferase [Thermoleophilia bacterium]